jgi:hypothetical protein
MNIFRLSNCPVECARQMQDLHIRKQVLETTQLLANGYSADQLVYAPYTQNGTMRKHSHLHHPISKWVLYNNKNFEWTLKHASALSDEFYWRFGKRHFCDTFISWCRKISWFRKGFPELIYSNLNEKETEQPQCFKQYPQCIVPGDPVAGYRNYYRVAKRSFVIRGKTIYATWTKREIPAWF